MSSLSPSAPTQGDAPSAAAPRRVQVWDLPTRLFHWALALAVTAALVTGQVGGDWIDWHGRAGLAVLGLLVFRLLWGFVGGTHARFASFWPTQARMEAYVLGRWNGLGHNPLGALSVLALLGLLAWQAGSGLFTNDEIAFTGPLNVLVSEELAARLTGWHRLGLWAVLGLVALHVAAIVWHRTVGRRVLLTPMLTGWAQGPAEEGTPEAPQRAGWAALVGAVLVALVAVYLAAGGLLS